MSTIESRTKDNINKKGNKKLFFINDNPNYNLNLFHLIKKINISKDEVSQQKDNEFIINILLMSSKLSETNKLACLLLLYYLSRKEQKNQNRLNYLYHKICKLCIKNEIMESEIVQQFLYFSDNNNFLILLQYLSQIKKIFPSDKYINKSYKSSIDTLESIINEKLNLYLEEIISKFSSFNIIPEEHLSKIKNILDQLFNANYQIKDTDTPLYIIDKIWLMKMKCFIEPYIVARKEQVSNLLCENSFNYNKVLELIKQQENDDNNSEKPLRVIFPGPINNLHLIENKDYWYDPINLEENFMIKNNLKYNENYFLVNKDDYFFLKTIFRDSNEIKRKNISDELIKFKIVIIEPNLRKNENKYLLKKRYMQINANVNIKELKNKIIRCINYELYKDEKNKDSNFYDKFYENNNVDFFVLNKKNKELLIELFIAFTNNIKIYESLYIQQINFEDNENCIKDLFNYFDKDSQILLVEIVPNNCYNFIKPIINEYKNPNIYNCSICGEQFNLREKYNCNLCNLSLFCSFECSKISGEHINLHEALNNFYIKKFDIKNFFKEKIDLHKDNIKELVPFSKDKTNNYSAINSIIHCFSNSTDLTKYFLKKKYLNDININDYLLNKTSFVKYYYDLINKIWNNEGKEKLDFYHKNFINYLLKKLDYEPSDNSSLNDVREIISFILINIHKEINRANILNISKQKENSIISDLFQGIYQTTFSCTKCGNVSIIYDFFRYLLLPIPKKNNNLTIKYISEYECKYMHYTIDDNSNIKELKDKAIGFLSDKINKIVQMMSVTDLIDITAFDTDDEKILTDVAMYNSVEFVQFDKNKILTKVYLTDKKDLKNNNEENNENDLGLQINKIYKENSDTELVFYEKSVFEEPCINIYIYPFLYNEKDKYSVNRDRMYHVYPIAFPVNVSLILENFEYYVNVKLRKILIDHYKKESEKSNCNYIELVYPHYFCNCPIYSSATCFLCKDRTKNALFCPLFSSVDKDLTIKDLIQKFDYPKQPIILLAKCKYFDTNKKYYWNVNSFWNKKETLKKTENKLDLYNCFQLYTKKETLEDIDWFCDGCNCIQICEKQLSIYSLPVYLIIQIDRFALKKINSKNIIDNTLINAPINEFDLGNYVEGPEKDKIKYIYNLYAIIYKDISSKNDFTYCTCKNGNKWILFKDNKIQITNELINKNVHFLFYKRKDAQQ